MSAWSSAMSLIDQRACGYCEARLSPGCTVWATHLHNRGQSSRVCPSTHVRVCTRCNAWIGIHQARARALGWYCDDSQDPERTPLLRHHQMVLIGSDGTIRPAEQAAS